jgi:hypothetical protein
VRTLGISAIGAAALISAGCTPAADPAPALSARAGAGEAPVPSATAGAGEAPVTPAPTVDSVTARAGGDPAPVNLRRVDWAGATIRMPELRDDKDCPAGAITLKAGEWAEAGGHGPGTIRGSYADGPPTYGDLDGDGRAEAVVYVSCFAAGGDSGDSSGQLLVVNGRGGALTGMGYVGPLAQVYGTLRVAGGRLRVTVTQKYSDVRQVRTYRWDGRRFAQVGGPTAFPSPPG